MKVLQRCLLSLPVLISLIGLGCRQPETTLAELKAQRWQLVQYTSGLGLTNPISGSEITLEFADDQLHGAAGCNEYFGEYEWRGPGNLAVSGQIGSTEKFCDEVMKQEQLYLMLLSEVTNYQLSTNSLKLSGPSGELVFQRKPQRQNKTVEMPQLLSGYYIMGNEVSVFRDCELDTTFTFWLMDESGTLDSAYKSITDKREYEPVYLEIEALRQPALMLGYASEHTGLVRVRRIRKIRLPDRKEPCFQQIRWG